MLVAPVHKDLVLVGGGHSHLAVLRRFGMRPIPGVRLTLISPVSAAPYSGMLPGLVAGYYSFDEAHIDLAPLSRFANARLIRAAATGIDPAARHVALAGRPPISYDVLSINTGSTPDLPAAVSGDPHVSPVKPVDGFLRAWTRILAAPPAASAPLRLAVVGGGAGGVELALAMAAHLDVQQRRAELTVLTADDSILPTHNQGVRRRLEAALERRRIHVLTGARVVASAGGTLELESGDRAAFDEIVWVTQASAPAWLRGSGLALDASGFLRVDDRLRSVSDERIFGAGDVASLDGQARPKSGVFAVRQGRPLADNLQAALLGRPLRAYRPQQRFLSLIGTGDGRAVASRGGWSCGGTAVWRVKEWIDRRFMARYHDLPTMDAGRDRLGDPVPTAISGADAPASAAPMRCGGCGAKTSAAVLDAALAGIATIRREDVVAGLDAPDDAALIRVPSGRLVAVSVDAFRPMLDDPWLFGRITANHCLNDLFAMGAEPQSALAIVTLPDWPEVKLVDELRQMLAGAVHELDACGAALVGGHTGEGAEVSLGFSVTGLLEGAPLAKRGLEAGDVLVLTKAVGTGALLAAGMQGRARGRWLDAAVGTMLLSGAAAGRILRESGVHACTDVTGFGLLGHLLEMARPARASVEIEIDAVPLIDGVLDCVAAGIRSTMAPKNAAFATSPGVNEDLIRHARSDLLLDPQTAGGLLAALPAERADDCIDRLRAAGYVDAAVVGRVLSVNLADGVTINIAR